MSIVSTTKAAAQAARERAVEDAIHSGEMEDLSVSPAFESDAAEYALGAIDIDELKSPVRGGSGPARARRSHDVSRALVAEIRHKNA